MAVLRKIVKWIQSHRVLSLAGLVALIGLGIFISIQVEHSKGTLVGPLARGDIIQSVYGIGTVTATKIYSIKSGITSTVTALYVQEGDTVKQGDRLVKMDLVGYNAPFDGTVTFLPYLVGDNIFANAPVLILVDLTNRYVVVSLEQQGALRILRGQKATLSFDTLRQSNFDGEVKSIYSNGTNFLARIDIPNFPSKILPGMTADVAITIATHKNALLLPIAALEDGKYVWVKNGIPKRVEIKTGFVDKSFAEVVSGDLKSGDFVLIRKQAGP